MAPVLFQLLRQYVTERAGAGGYAQLLCDAGIEDDAITSDDRTADATLFGLIELATHIVKEPADAICAALGKRLLGSIDVDAATAEDCLVALRTSVDDVMAGGALLTDDGVVFDELVAPLGYCRFHRGQIAGIGERYRRATHVRELVCKSQGAPSCVFEVRYAPCS